jgi:AhpD family alkylhydroperoxidase
MTKRVTSPSTLGRIQQQVVPLERYLATTELETNLLHLIKLRASQINGCAYCMSMHTRDLLAAGDRIDRIAVLPAWRESTWFTAEERAALAFTEAVTTLSHQEVSEDVFAAASAQFNDQQLADLTLAIATINVWNRLCITWQVEPDPFTVGSPDRAG